MKFVLLTIALTVMTVSAQDVVTNIVPTDADEAAFSTNTTATNISETIPAPAETSAMSSTPEDISVPDIHQPEDLHASDIHADEPGESSTNPRLPGK